MVRHVHPLPSVKVQDGSDFLREGDEPAAFSVHFTGTPPFTVTYTRSEVIGSKARVVDAQTVTDIWEKDYTISSSSPGDYEVTSVSDKYCRYPPLKKRGDT
jgi:nucleoporin POM152